MTCVNKKKKNVLMNYIYNLNIMILKQLYYRYYIIYII